MDKLYFKVFNNDILKNKIYTYIKEFNSKLLYKCFNYYEFPLELIIKTKNYQMFIERLKIININYYHYQSINNNNNELNLESFKLLLSWNEINLDLFIEIIEKTLNYQINKLLIINNNQLSINNIVLSSNCNILKFKYLINQFPQIKFQDSTSSSNNYEIYQVNENSIKLLDYLLNEYNFKELSNSILNLIYNIIIIQKEPQLYLKSLFNLISNNFSNDYLKEIIYETINLAVQINDEYSFKLVVSIYNDNGFMESSNNNNSLFGLENLTNELFSKISKYSLFKSNNLNLFKLMLINIKPDLLNVTSNNNNNNNNTEIVECYDIIDNEIALFLISNIPKQIISNPIYRFNYSCFKEFDENNNAFGIKDISPFKKLNVFIRDNSTKYLTISKLNIFQQIRVILDVKGNIDGFNGNIELFKMFHQFYKLNSVYDYLDVFKSAIINGHKELVEHMLLQTKKDKVFIPLFNQSYLELKQIFNIHGNDCMPFETANSKIESGILYYFIIIKPEYQDLSIINLNQLPKDPLKRELFLNNIYKTKLLININNLNNSNNNINNNDNDNDNDNDNEFNFNMFD